MNSLKSCSICSELLKWYPKDEGIIRAFHKGEISLKSLPQHLIDEH